MADMRGDVAGLSVDRAVGSQGRLPAVQPTSKPTSWRIGSLEKSKDRSEASAPSISGDSVSVNLRTGRTGRSGLHHRRRPRTAVSREFRHTLLRASQSRGETCTCNGSPSR